MAGRGCGGWRRKPSGSVGAKLVRRFRARKRGPECQKSPRWSAGRRVPYVTGHAAPRQVRKLLMRLLGAPLPFVGEGKEMKASRSLMKAGR